MLTTTKIDLPSSAAVRIIEIRVALLNAGYEAPAIDQIKIDPRGRSDLDVALEMLGESLPLNVAAVGNLSPQGRVIYERGRLRDIAHVMKRGQAPARVYAASANVAELQAIGLTPAVVGTLADLVECIRGGIYNPAPARPLRDNPLQTFDDYRGLDVEKAALRAAVEVGGPIRIHGAPGSGRTILARRIPSLLPIPDADTYVEMLCAYSDAGMSDFAALPRAQAIPFRAPHHTCAVKALEQEVRLARGGVLFLDEAEELREPQIAVIHKAIAEGACRVVMATSTESKTRWILRLPPATVVAVGGAS